MTNHEAARLAEPVSAKIAHTELRPPLRVIHGPNYNTVAFTATLYQDGDNESLGLFFDGGQAEQVAALVNRALDAAARPHAEFVTRAMYDAAIAERDDAQARSGTYMGHECCVCGFPIHGVMIGMGDGTGQRFGHRDCYERERAEAAELKVAMLEKALAELERDVDGYKQTVSLQYERGDRLAAALAASEAKLCEALRALGMRAIGDGR